MNIPIARLDKFYQMAWWLVVVTMPWAITINNIALMVLVFAWLSHGNFYEKWLSFKKSPWIFPFILLFSIYVIGLIYSNNFTSGLNDVLRKIPILALPMIATTGPLLSISFINYLKRSFAYSCFTIAIVSLFIAAIRLYTDGATSDNLGVAESQYHDLHSSASLIWLHFSYIQVGRWGDLHPSYLSMFLLFSIVILMNEMVNNMKHDVLRTTAVVVMILFIGLLASRMAVLAFIASSFYLIIIDIRKRLVRHTIYFSLTVFILIASIWYNPVARFRIVEEPISTSLSISSNTTKWNSVSYRLLEWKGAWSVIWKNPLFGVGTGDGDQELKTFYSNYNTSTVAIDYNAHNQYLQTWLETGIVGLVLLLLCLLIPLIKLRNNPSDISFIIIFSSMCLTESILERQKGIIFFSLFFAILLCTKKSNQ